MAKTQQITLKNGRWPEEFLKIKIANLIDQLSKHERWNRQAVTNLKTEQASLSGFFDTEADCAQIFADTEVNRISAECSAKIISQIRAALTLISNDLRSRKKHRYGQCGQCEKAIDSARLEAIPWATKCTACQQAEELQ